MNEIHGRHGSSKTPPGFADEFFLFQIISTRKVCRKCSKVLQGIPTKSDGFTI
jgi:hypothetical protein